MKRSKPFQRKTELKAKTDHDWMPRLVGGVRHWVCARCNSLWIAGTPPVTGCTGLKQVPLNPVNTERKQRMRTDPDTGEQHTYGPYHRWIEKQPCIITRKTLYTEGHHVKHVGAGGRDYANEVPLDHALHVEVHSIGEREFCEKYDLSPLSEIAERMAYWYDGGAKGSRAVEPEQTTDARSTKS